MYRPSIPKWCTRWDLNPHDCSYEPESYASANFATGASINNYISKVCYNNDMIKYFFCDIDGTLVDSNGVVSNQDIYWINELEKNGITFVVSSGRPIKALNSIFNALGKQVAASCLCGAYYIDQFNNKTIDYPLSESAIRSIYKVSQLVDNTGLTGFAQDIMISVLPIKDFLMNTFGITEVPKDGPMSDWLIDIHHISNVEEIVQQKVYKLEFHFNTEKDTKEAMDLLNKIEDINPVLAAPKNIEITSKFASKGLVIEHLCQLNNISTDQVAAIGDSGNDLPMLQTVKYSFAMGNAMDNVKDICYKVVSDNNHSGVSEAIKWILKEKI